MKKTLNLSGRFRAVWWKDIRAVRMSVVAWRSVLGDHVHFTVVASKGVGDTEPFCVFPNDLREVSSISRVNGFIVVVQRDFGVPRTRYFVT